MIVRRLILSVACVTGIVAATPAHAAGVLSLYPNVTSAGCQDGTFELTMNASDGTQTGCSCVNCQSYQGTAAFNPDDATYPSTKRVRTVVVDGKRALTGTFVVNATSGAAMVSIDFEIKIARQRIGVVHVEGNVLPNAPLKKTFSLSLAKVNRVKTNTFVVSSEWTTCVGVCSVGLQGASFITVPTR